MNRRRLLVGAASLAGAGLMLPSAALADTAINAETFGVRPGAPENQRESFTRMLDANAETGVPIFLPPGDYILSDIRLPRSVRLLGVPGASRIVHGGNGHLFIGEDAALVHLDGITLDGGGHRAAGQVKAALELRRVADFVMERCTVANSGASGVVLESVSGRIERNTIVNCRDYGIYAVESGDMRISGNTVTDCADGGILVHRWQSGPDGTMVTGNRIERIGARSGGTGQYGNGINLYRAGNVIVSGNHIADCAFSAIRGNGASNAQITGNQCLRSGETAIYSEFEFQGAVIVSNIVDTAAIGISISNLDVGGRLAVCQGNLVRNLVAAGPYEPFEAMGFGIGIVAEADTAIAGNVIEHAARCGVQLGWGPYLRDVVATGNVIRDSPEGFAISVVDGVGPVLVADNLISGAQRAIAGYRWKESVAADLSSDTAPRFPRLTIERNLIS